ncbi:O-antigen ligase family protein [Methylomonas methanica]|uniref:O-antigen ligase-related domain-containing protein n=1 Tax=Methylomonas methanica TaxID=421 RepID=A0A177MCU2_METMH|nr:O-antigen ligase family protein [Methylomonas methanica]OAI03354.1 hypothetical protein A1332_15975 [Methylomonas methanica]
MNSFHFGVIGNSKNFWLDFYIFILLVSSILGFLTIRGCTNASLFLLTIPAIIELKSAYNIAKKGKTLDLMLPIIFTLTLPLTAVFISQTLRQDWVIKAYDGPSRMFLSTLLILYFSYKKIDFSKLISITAPVALLLTVPVIYLHPDILEKWGGRFATVAVDPTQFGTYTLVLTAFCLFGIETPITSPGKLLVIQTLGLLAGLYLITGSGTRGSWLALPPLILLWIMLKGRMIHIRALLIFAVVFFIGLILISLFHPKSLDRLVSGYQELSAWLDGSNRETSTGFRLTMWQISWELFKHSPIYGFGDIGFGDYLREPWITNISSPESRQIILYNGPHNEFLANLLRSGLLGGITVLCQFLIPATLFWKNRHDLKAYRASHLGLAFITCLIFCSISSEVLTLKFTTTFYGLIIAGLASQIIKSKEIIPALTPKGDSSI